MVCTSAAEMGTITKKKGKKAGARTAVTTTAPVRLLTALRPPSKSWRTICSMVSTSRTTLFCSTPALARAK